MSIVSLALGIVIGILIAAAVMFAVFWWTDTHEGRNEKKWSDADFDRIFHEAWNSGFEHGKRSPFVMDEKDEANGYKGGLMP